MELQELFVQSIGPFFKPRKFSFSKGLNVLYGKNGSGKTTLVFSFLSLLDSDFCLKNKKKIKPWVPQDAPSRAGAVFIRENRIFKILRDVESLGIALQEKKEGKFVTVAKGKKVEDFFIDELDFPFAGDFRELMYVPQNPNFLFPEKAEVSSTYPSPFEGFEDFASSQAPATSNPEERLKELKEELERAEKIEELEFKMEGLEQKEFEIEAKLKEIKELEDEVSKINEFLQRYSEIQNFPTDFDEKLKKIPDMKREVEDLEEDLNMSREDLLAEVDELKASIKKYHKDPIFIVTVVVALLGFLLPNITKLPGWLVFFGLGGIGFAVYWVLFVYPSKEDKVKKKEEEVNRILAEKKKKLNTLKDELKVIYELAEYVGVDDPKEIGKLIKKFWGFVKKKKELEEEIKLKKEAIGFDSITSQQKEIREEIEKIKSELQELGRPTMDINTIKQEIARLEGKAETAESPEFAGAPVDNFGMGFTAEEEPDQPPIFTKILQLGEKLSRRTTSQLVAGISGKFEKYLFFLSSKRFARGLVEEDYRVNFVFASSGKEVDWASLSPGDLLIVYLSLLLSVAELVGVNRQLPLIIDSNFSELDDSTFLLLLKLLHKIGENIQILMFTGREVAQKAAHHSLTLS